MQNLVFETVEINNFKSIEYIDFNFTPNRFVMLTGLNGSGKSTLATDSIFWALYDQTPKGIKGDSILRKRHPKDCCVKLKFKIDNDEYFVENYREHKEFKNKKIISKNGVKLSDERDAVNKIISTILMPKDIFSNCLLFSQFLEKSFIELDYGSQRDILDKMLNLEHFNEYQKKYNDYIKEKDIIIDNLLNSAKVQTQIEEIKSTNLDEIDKKVVYWNDYYKKINEESIEHINSIMEIEMKLLENISNVDIEKLENSRDLGIKYISKLENKKVNLLSNYNKQKTDEEVKVKLASDAEDNKLKIKYQAKIEELNKRKSELENDLEKLKSKTNKEVSDLQLKFQDRNKVFDDECNTQINPLNQSLTSNQTTLLNVETNIRKIEIIVNNLVHEIAEKEEKLNSTNPTCFVCGQELKDEITLSKVKIVYEEQKTLFDTNNKELEQLNIKKNDIIDIVSKLKEQISNLNINLKEKKDKLIESKDKKLNEMKVQYTEDKDEISKWIGVTQNSIDSVKKDYSDEFNKVKAEILQKFQEEERKMTDNFNKNMETKNQEIFESSSRLELIKQSIIDFNTSKQKIDLYKNQLLNLESGIKQNNIIWKKTTDELNLDKINIENEIVEIRKESDNTLLKITNESREKEISEFWTEAFSDRGIKSILFDECIPILNQKAIELSSLTNNIRVNFDSQKKNKKGTLSDKFSVNAIQLSNLTDNVKEFSAGESRLVDIITLLSLRYLLEKIHDMKINLILLDEVLDALDPVNVEVVIDMIKKLAEDHCILLISHTFRDTIECDEHLQL